MGFIAGPFNNPIVAAAAASSSTSFSSSRQIVLNFPPAVDPSNLVNPVAADSTTRPCRPKAGSDERTAPVGDAPLRQPFMDLRQPSLLSAEQQQQHYHHQPRHHCRPHASPAVPPPRSLRPALDSSRRLPDNQSALSGLSPVLSPSFTPGLTCGPSPSSSAGISTGIGAVGTNDSGTSWLHELEKKRFSNLSRYEQDFLKRFVKPHLTSQAASRQEHDGKRRKSSRHSRGRKRRDYDSDSDEEGDGEDEYEEDSDGDSLTTDSKLGFGSFQVQNYANPAAMDVADSSSRINSDTRYEDLQPGSREQREEWLGSRFQALQENQCKDVLLKMINVIEPNKNRLYPYQSKRRSSKKPPWWPENMAYTVGPHHMTAEDRRALLVHITLLPLTNEACYMDKFKDQFPYGTVHFDEIRRWWIQQLENAVSKVKLIDKYAHEKVAESCAEDDPKLQLRKRKKRTLNLAKMRAKEIVRDDIFHYAQLILDKTYFGAKDANDRISTQGIPEVLRKDRDLRPERDVDLTTSSKPSTRRIGLHSHSGKIPSTSRKHKNHISRSNDRTRGRPSDEDDTELDDSDRGSETEVDTEIDDNHRKRLRHDHPSTVTGSAMVSMQSASSSFVSVDDQTSLSVNTQPPRSRVRRVSELAGAGAPSRLWHNTNAAPAALSFDSLRPGYLHTSWTEALDDNEYGTDLHHDSQQLWNVYAPALHSVDPSQLRLPTSSLATWPSFTSQAIPPGIYSMDPTAFDSSFIASAATSFQDDPLMTRRDTL